MTSVVQPDLIPQPWSQNGSHTTIPDTTSEFGRASWALGFPPETALPLNAGGIPPNWLDFQGVLYALSQHAIFEQAGGRYAWAQDVNYPAGACIIGSNGVVYQALQESGPGTAAGIKNPTTAGNTAYWGILATPDGSTIKVANGKLAADTVTLAASLADGTTITANNGKLSSVGGGGDASSLADGETIVASNDKLKVNYGTGLSYDSTDTHKLVVDFSQIDDATRASILAGLLVQIPLTANKIIYVNGETGSDNDSENDFRNRIKLANPGKFKTIGAAVKFLTTWYAVGSHAAGIYVDGLDTNNQPLTYAENTALPQFSRTSGYIVIRATNYNNPPIITNLVNNYAPFSVTGSGWLLRGLNFDCSVVASDDGAEHFPSCIDVDGGEISIYACTFKIAYTGSAPSSGHTYIRMIEVLNGGTASFAPYLFTGAGATQHGLSFDFTKGNANGLTVLLAARKSNIAFYGTSSSSAISDVASFGTCTTFCECMTDSLVSRVGGTAYPLTFSVPSGKTLTGTQKYDITGGSGILAPSGGFPGSYSGSPGVDSSTYCWYQS